LHLSKQITSTIFQHFVTYTFTSTRHGFSAHVEKGKLQGGSFNSVTIALKDLDPSTLQATFSWSP